jgi:hypothetical protein
MVSRKRVAILPHIPILFENDIKAELDRIKESLKPTAIKGKVIERWVNFAWIHRFRDEKVIAENV